MAHWGSALRVGDFAVIRSVGFEPVGQVFGAAVYYLGTVLGAGCPGTSAEYALRDPPYLPGETTGRSLAPVYGAVDPAAKVAQGLYEGRRTAIERMTDQCAELGGHGVVGAALRIKEIPPDALTAGAIEFTVIGTAVRAVGRLPLRRPFASDLSGPDFAKLIMTGWVPAGIALGISVSGLHDDSVTTSSGPLRTGNAEVPAYTALVTKARQDARRYLGQAVRGVGADGVGRVRHNPSCPNRRLPRASGRHGLFRGGSHHRHGGNAVRLARGNTAETLRTAPRRGPVGLVRVGVAGVIAGALRRQVHQAGAVFSHCRRRQGVPGDQGQRLNVVGMQRAEGIECRGALHHVLASRAECPRVG